MKLVLKDYERFIFKMARYYHKRNSSMEFNDLVQAGWLGLLEAYQKFDDSYENTFLTYAAWYVKKYMLEASYASTTIEFPADIRKIHNEIEHAKIEIKYVDNADVSTEKISDKTGIPVKKIEKYEHYFAGYHMIPDVDTIEHHLACDDMRYISIKMALEELPEDKRTMLLERLEGQSLQEMSKKYDCSIEWVRLLVNEIISNMRKQINGI